MTIVFQCLLFSPFGCFGCFYSRKRSNQKTILVISMVTVALTNQIPYQVAGTVEFALTVF